MEQEGREGKDRDTSADKGNEEKSKSTLSHPVRGSGGGSLDVGDAIDAFV